MKKRINFSNPFNGKKWLSLLEPSSKFGMLFKKDLNYGKQYMGFSFQSNKFGLRGPENTQADEVICGTSYAMGLSVDNGKNWYELNDSYKNFFNIGMPVGFKHHSKILETYYKGSYETLIFLYHPNIWITNKNFYGAEKKNLDIFSYMGWNTNPFYVLYLYARWILKENLKVVLKKKEVLKKKGNKYHLNLKYSYFSDKQEHVINNIINDFFILGNKFKKIIIYRVPIKEEIALQYSDNPNLKSLNDNYEKMFNTFVEELSQRGLNMEIHSDLEKFDLEDYLEQDTHWNENGNLKFHEYFTQTFGAFND